MAGISTPAIGNITISGADGAIQDGVSSLIKATVLDYTNSNPLAVRLTDTSGDYVSAGAGTQYTEGDTDTTITGTATMMEVASNVLQPIQGTVADGLLVNLGTNNDVTVTGDALTSLQLIDDVVRAEDTAHTTADKGVFILGVRNSSNSALTTTDGDYSPINVDDTGSPQVVIKSGSSKVTGNISSEDADSGEPVKVGGKYNLTPITLTDGDRGDIQLNAAGDVKVSLDSESVAVTNSGITTIAGAVAGTEMQVDVLTMPTVTVTATNLDVQSGGADLATSAQGSAIQAALETVGGLVVNLGANNDVTITGDALTALQLIDNPVYVDDADWTADTSSHSLVGSVTQVAPTANTDGDTTPLISDALRQLRVAALESDLATAGTAHVKKYYTSAGAATDGIIWSPTAGKRWFLTHLSINVSAASTVTIEDDLAGGDSPVYKAEFAANSGVVLTFPEVPMFSGEDAADLLITTSAGNVYVTAVGYEI